jgi:flagellar basal-body rod protein FlgG|tara:strand:+ start:371 stop:1180 length:810 start_codon:yes stop_codon:yes gene_type:complete
MNVSLYQAATAMDASSRWQEAVSENLAELSRPGFKRNEISFSSMVAGKMEKPLETVLKTTDINGNEVETAILEEKPFQLPKPKLSTNFEQGPIQQTQNKSDIALVGSGFLRVKDQQGNNLYTRDGELKLLPTGELVTKEGYSTGLQLNDPNRLADLVINKGGGASQGGEAVGQLEVVAFNDALSLKRISGAYYRADDPNDQGTLVENLTPDDEGYTNVEHGFLEQSNSTSLSEMTNLIRSLRHFEANQQVIRAHDQRLGQAIQALSATQ